jgi:hypothetical protein
MADAFGALVRVDGVGIFVIDGDRLVRAGGLADVAGNAKIIDDEGHGFS